jgi:hypothetical protein
VIDMTARIHRRKTVTGLIGEYRAELPDRSENAQLSASVHGLAPYTAKQVDSRRSGSRRNIAPYQ